MKVKFLNNAIVNGIAMHLFNLADKNVFLSEQDLLIRGLPNDEKKKTAFIL